MFSHRLVPFIAFATVLTFATPARAAVRYDPEGKTGFVGRNDIRKAFGWTGAVLAARADSVTFGHDFWTDDTYTVRCGAAAFPVVHHRAFGRFELISAVARDGRRGAASGYGPRPAGFRLTGASSGISGTSVAPAAGQPCPAGPGAGTGAVIGTADLVSSETGWALTAGYGDVRHRLTVSLTEVDVRPGS